MQRPDSADLEERLYKMKTGDTFTDSVTGWYILRVPGGWIYSHDALAVFVPETAIQKKEVAKPGMKPVTKPDDIVLPAKKTRGK